mmetsp:Transcript_1433/g.3844  ORF Transcript_1433/g.3844 Transcript_1433/m.3844 type:complete len:221 (-) Transcript_1433:79-741(-)
MGYIGVGGLADPVRGISEVPRTGVVEFHRVHMQRGIHRFVSVNILAATTQQYHGPGLIDAMAHVVFSSSVAQTPETPRFRVHGIDACKDCAHRLIRVQVVHPIESENLIWERCPDDSPVLLQQRSISDEQGVSYARRIIISRTANRRLLLPRLWIWRMKVQIKARTHKLPWHQYVGNGCAEKQHASNCPQNICCHPQEVTHRGKRLSEKRESSPYIITWR